MKRPTDMAIGSGVVVALVVVALVPVLQIPALAALVIGVFLAPRDAAWRWALAAGVPIVLIFVWGSLAGSPIQDDASGCADPLSAVAWSRALEAALVIGTIVMLARWLGASPRSLGLRRPSRLEAWLGIAAIVLIPIPSLYIGAILAEPFFGQIQLDLSQPLAIVPALILAIANGTMEELAYRGALMSWLSRAAGPMVGLLGQAVVFGVAHAGGGDYVDAIWAVPVALVIGAGGLIAGLIVRRTGSLWLPIIVHICFDVPLYYAAACQLQ